jgi:hypothetical protein
MLTVQRAKTMNAMNPSRDFKSLAIFLLLLFAFLLYGDLGFIHQIHPITESMISRASDEQTRQQLIESRDRRSSYEGFEKLKVKLVLATDLLLVAYIARALIREPLEPPQPLGRPFPGK